MKKIICFLLTFVLLICLTACGNPDLAIDEPKQNIYYASTQFALIEDSRLWDIAYDINTGVMYAISRSPYNQGNFTVLVNADGTPRIYEGFDVK